MDRLKDIKNFINRKSNYRFDKELNELYSNDFKLLMKVLGSSDLLDVTATTIEKYDDNDDLHIHKAIILTNNFKSDVVLEFDEEDNLL